MVLAAVLVADHETPKDFFPMQVEYREKFYAAGKIPGGFFKREGRPTEAAILLCRLTDRSIRPLFPKGMRNEGQIIITALSSDGENILDVLAINAASCALSISNVPFDGPVGAARVGYIDGELVLNPTATEMATSTLDLRVHISLPGIRATQSLRTDEFIVSLLRGGQLKLRRS